MVNIQKFHAELEKWGEALSNSKRVLITAPGAADGDSIGAQLAIRRMLRQRFPQLDIAIINDEALPPRYHFLPDAEFAETPESYLAQGRSTDFDMGILCDGGIDRAGRVRPWYEACKTQVFVDHHVVSCKYNYSLCLVESTAAATTEIVYHISQTPLFRTTVDQAFAQQIYLGLVFDTGFFRHSNTTPAVLELAAHLLRTGFDFTRVGERGMLERSCSSLKLMADTLTRAELAVSGKIIWASLSQSQLDYFHAEADDREGIIDHLFLTHGVEVAMLLFELPKNKVKVSLRSQGRVDVASFAKSITEHGGGHKRAAGALLEMPLKEAEEFVLKRLERVVCG